MKRPFTQFRLPGSNSIFSLLAAAAVAAAGFIPGLQAQHSYIANGDLETLDAGTPLFESWTNNAGTTLAQQAIAGANSARIAHNTTNNGNALNPVAEVSYANLTTYTFSFDFAASDPGSATARSLHVNLRIIEGSQGGNVAMRVVSGSEAGKGTVQVFDAGWQTALENVVDLSTAESGAGFVVNTATITGDYTAATPFYTITVNGNVSPALSFFQDFKPAQGTPLAEVTFQSGNIATSAWAVVDNVVLEGPTPPDEDPDPDPEPDPEGFLSNGDFEILDPSPFLYEFWTNNAGVTAASQVIGGEQSPRIAASTANIGNALNQTLFDPEELLSTYSLSFDFATSDPGSATARSMQLSLRTVPGAEGGNVNMRVVTGTEPGMGTVEVFQGGWQTAVANAVHFSTAESGDGFVLNAITIAGDYTGATPFYSIEVNGSTSPSLSFFQASPPAQGDTLAQVSFQSGNIATGAWSVIDNLVLTDSSGSTPPPQPLQVFWSEVDLGTIQTALADNSNHATVLSGLNRPLGVRIDPETEAIYWTEEGASPGSAGDGLIARANLDGSQVTPLYAATAGDIGMDNPQQLVLDRAGGFIYWADLNNGVYRAPIDGSGPVQLIYSDGWGTFKTVALDLAGGYLYFGEASTGQLYRTDLTGGNLTYGPSSVSTAFNDLVFEAQGGKLYFPDTDAIHSYTPGGSRQTVVSSLNSPMGLAISPDSNRLFFAERGSEPRISVVGLNGADLAAVITGLNNPFGVAVIEGQAAGFDQWRAAQFNAAELADESISGPDAAPAGDGIPNLLKYAFGLDAKVSGRDGLPVAELVGGEMQLTYRRVKNVSDVTLVVEVSSDLVTWNSGASFVEEVSIADAGDVELVTVRLLAPLANAPRAFLRVLAEMAE